MSADNHANYAKVGAALVFGTLAIIGTIIYIGGVGNSARERYIETYYDEPVSGLSIGSSVCFRGVKVGEVRDISFTCDYYDNTADADMQRIRIVMAVDPRKLGYDVAEGEDVMNASLARYVKAGMRATISSSGITGLSKIEIGIQDNPEPLAPLTWRPEFPLIPPQPSLFANVSKSLSTALCRFNNTDFASVWSNIQSLTESSASVATDLKELLAAERASIKASVDNLGAMSSDVRDLASELKDNPSLLLRPRDAEPLPETER